MEVSPCQGPMRRLAANYHKTLLYLKDLPKAFEGFKIVQISDVHSGSYDDPEGVIKGIDIINEQDADLFVFTGDFSIA